MVSKKRYTNSNLILNLVVMIFFAALIAYLVMAANTKSQTATLVSPVDGGNYSDTSIDFNCTLKEANDSENGHNASL